MATAALQCDPLVALVLACYIMILLDAIFDRLSWLFIRVSGDHQDYNSYSSACAGPVVLSLSTPPISPAKPAPARIEVTLPFQFDAFRHDLQLILTYGSFPGLH